MIRDLSLSFRNMITRGATGFPELSAAQITFDRPSDGYSPPQPTVSLYLYDIRENLELRSNEPSRQAGGDRVAVQRAPVRLACSYLVTAWPGNVTGDELALREHRLLAQVFQVIIRAPTLPPTALVGLLAGQAPPLPVMIAHNDGLKNPSEFWTAMANKMRPSLNVTLTVSMATLPSTTAPQVIGSEIVFKREGTVAADLFRIGGHILDATGKPVVGASVAIAALGKSVATDANGQYVLGPMPAGAYTLHVVAAAKTVDVPITIPATSANAYDVKLA